MNKYAPFTDELTALGIEFRQDVSATTLTSFKTGGKVDFCLYPSAEPEFCEAVRLCQKYGIRYFFLGRGSNSLISDDGYRGAAILTEKINEIKSEEVENDKVRIYSACGTSLTYLALYAANSSLTGLEFAYGIPGSVGGAVYMNAGAYGGQMSDVIERTVYYDVQEDRIGEFFENDNGFSYRKSIYSDSCGRFAVLGAYMVLKRSDKDTVISKCRENMNLRIEKQPLEYPSAGSVFKRHEGYYIGKVIEECGLKGHSVGGAKVSEKHAGFIVNYNGATTSDVSELIDYVSRVIFEKYKFKPECEIKLIK